MDTLQPGRSQWIGRPLRRLEDARLLTGQGRFTDDLDLPGQLHAAFVRSPHAHARIAGIDVAAAAAMPGVVAVYTGADVEADGIGPLPFLQLHKRPGGAAIEAPPRRALTIDVARFVGDAVALVLAETRQQAKDAAEQVSVDWQPLAAVADARDAARDDAPQVWPAAFAAGWGNVAAYYETGDDAPVSDAFARAARVVRVTVRNQRVVSNPLEPRAALAQYDEASATYTLWCPTQNTHLVCAQLADGAFRIDKARLRVVCTDMGGGFGTRGYAYPEYVAVCWAARRARRPVKWLGDRSEIFLTDTHGRDNWTEAALALDAEHRFLALSVRTVANVGAYLSQYGAAVPAMSGARAATGPYRIPLLRHEVRMMFSHTTPVDAYRGAGRPEMGYLLERLVSRAALEAGVDAAALRRRNLVTAAEMPWRNAVGHTYDCGDFPRILDACAHAAEWEGYAARAADSRVRGLLRGRGVACYVEVTGSARLEESVDVTIAGDGTVTVAAGTQPMGQGLWTSYAQIVAERLCIAPEQVVLVHGDTARIASGGGSGGSRSLQVGGTAVLAGANAAADAARRLAAQSLEAAEGDLELDGGRFRIAGTDRSIGLFELAARAPDGRIAVTASGKASAQTWPNGCQVAEVEIDPDTGSVRVVRHVAVDDIGRVMNPLIAHGQVEGGIVQGLGQALLEDCVHDAAGQLLSGSFMDYALPRADDVPDLVTAFDQSIPTAHNALGAKGVGEAGCHGATPAIVNAVIDALAGYGVRQIDMPVTREKVWRALRGAA
jgi:carbon-monoxide dehydrogenase large subunit